jgi:release factor glutamine methyltransferase
MTAPATRGQGSRRLLDAAARTLSAAGIDSPRLDAELLLASVLGCSRLDLLLGAGVPPGAAARRDFARLVRARERHEPVAYLVGVREFFGRDFRVDRRVLVPRPETEVLVHAAAGFLAGRPAGKRRVADLGTGSGCIAVTLALEVRGAEVVATDLSEDALEVARANASRMGAAVAFARGDLLEALPGGARFDLVVSNPPYVAPDEIGDVDRSVRDFEPRSAWLSEAGALAFHRRILGGASGSVASDGAVMLELGSGAAELAVETPRLWPGAGARVLADLAGHPRVVVAGRECSA